jgi:hypothetical protein
MISGGTKVIDVLCSADSPLAAAAEGPGWSGLQAKAAGLTRSPADPESESDWVHLGTLGSRGGERAATTLPCREWRSSYFGAAAGRSVGSERRRRQSADWAIIVCVRPGGACRVNTV